MDGRLEDDSSGLSPGFWPQRTMSLGIYISVPFCKTKCTYCNFASGVFSRERYANYVECLCADIRNAERKLDEVLEALVKRMRDRKVDSIVVTNPDGVLMGLLYVEDAEGYLKKSAAI